MRYALFLAEKLCTTSKTETEPTVTVTSTRKYYATISSMLTLLFPRPYAVAEINIFHILCNNGTHKRGNTLKNENLAFFYRIRLVSTYVDTRNMSYTWFTVIHHHS